MKTTLRSTAVLAALATTALFAGCSTQGQISGETMEQATSPLTCMNRAECDAWWGRAQVWVTNHSGYKLQTVTDSIIQTAGPSGGKRALAYQITKTPSNEGTATIGFAAHCDNMLGCEPNPWKAGADFKQFVRGSAATQSGSDSGSDSGSGSGGAGNAMPPVTPAAPPRAQSNPPVQPMPPALDAQPGQSNQPLTPQ